jgi:predicted metal-binding membrane protein
MQHRLVTAPSDRLRQVAPAIWLVGLAWLVLIAFSITGNGAVIRHDRLLQDGPPLWLATILFIGAWQVMLWAMMVPASLHAFARVELGRPAALFAVGYLAIWTAFGLLVFFFDAGVHDAVNHWTWLALHPWLIAGTTLVLTGTYQLSDLKARSLTACRAIKHAVARDDAIVQGARHGLGCLGSSGGLMLLAFALGAGNLLTMAAITLLMVWEVTPWGSAVLKIAGYSLIALGIVVMAGPLTPPEWWRL